MKTRFTVSVPRLFRTSLAGAMAAMSLIAASCARAAEWISHPEASASAAVLNFQKTFSLSSVPEHLFVRISGDNRFVFYVNGKRVASGPATSDLAHWRYERVDIAPYLTKGENTLSAVVWSASAATRPLAQISARTGFYLDAEEAQFETIDSGHGWSVAQDKGRSFASGFSQINKQLKTRYYVASAPEVHDAEKANWGWEHGAGEGVVWVAAVAALKPGEESPWMLSQNPLPPQLYERVNSGAVVRTDLAQARDFPNKPFSIAANSRATVLMRRDAMVSGYPSLTVRGGKGATIKVTYTEALYDENNERGDRNEVGDRQAKGVFDLFRPDGAERTLAPLYWRTWRYIEFEIETGDEPLTLQSLATYETGYPFEQRASFVSDDPELNRIWDIGWRTARVDAHETYMDSAYWEQLQYVGDTRFQALISYAVSGDDRLAVNAIDTMGRSYTREGVLEGAYPVHRGNTIPPFSLLWIGMLSDYYDRLPDTELLRRNLPRVHEVLSWFEGYMSPDNLMGKNPGWNFIDWAPQTKTDRSSFPSYDAAGHSCLMTLHYLGALQQAGKIERAVGSVEQGAAYDDHAGQIAAALRQKCWSADKGLYADTPALDSFSQHTNALAVLYGVARKDEAGAILDRIVIGNGIDAPQGMTPVSYYYSWYLIRAFEASGRAYDYHALLQTWRDLLALNFTTWPEEASNPRSDTHAWSAHPTADMLEIIAGIKPASAHYGSARIEPHLGPLKKLDARVQTPKGAVFVSYRVRKNRLKARVTVPEGLPAVFVWNGKETPLRAGKTTTLNLLIGGDL